jgi:hypothetical protein
MCSPTAMAVMAVVGKASEISATNQAAEAQQNAAIDQQRAMNSQRAQEAEMENKKTALELTQKKREALREQASARAASAESGVAGGSPLRNLVNVHMQESMEAGSIVSLNESRIATIGKQSEADFLKTRSAINVAESKKSTGLSAALQIGVAGGTAWGTAGGESPF